MKKQIFAVLALLGTLSAPAVAVEVTGNAGLYSQYMWRGIPASDENAAVQGGADASWDTGWSAGVWGSNAATPSQSGIEVDLYGGWGASTGDWNYFVGGTYYTFTDRVSDDFIELNLNGGWKWLSVNVAYGEYDTSPSYNYLFASLTGEYKGFYGTVGTWDWESGGPANGTYLEAGYSNTLKVKDVEIFDYKLSYIYSDEDLLLSPSQGRNTLVAGISRSFGLYKK